MRQIRFMLCKVVEKSDAKYIGYFLHNRPAEDKLSLRLVKTNNPKNMGNVLYALRLTFRLPVLYIACLSCMQYIPYRRNQGGTGAMAPPIHPGQKQGSWQSRRQWRPRGSGPPIDMLGLLLLF